MSNSYYDRATIGDLGLLVIQEIPIVNARAHFQAEFLLQQ
jgi:hypothetical protein